MDEIIDKIGGGKNFTMSEDDVSFVTSFTNGDSGFHRIYLVRYCDGNAMPAIKAFSSKEKASIVAYFSIVDTLQAVQALPKRVEKDYRELLYLVNENKDISTIIAKFNRMWAKAKFGISLDIIELKVI